MWYAAACSIMFNFERQLGNCYWEIAYALWVMSERRWTHMLSKCGVCYHTFPQVFIYLMACKYKKKKTIYLLWDKSWMQNRETETFSGCVFPWAGEETKRR